MPAYAPYRLNRSALLLALIAAGYASQAAAAAARVDFTTGGVTVAGRDGRERPLAKGAELDSGDTVRTNNGRAQLRFTDGSYVSLQPNSEFGITEYRYEGKADGSERGFFALVKGALRTVTGAVGRTNRDAYRVSTPTATVGIRGTGGVIQVLPDGATLVIGTSGIWSLSNPAGTIDVPAGVSALAPTEPKSPPRETSTQPAASAPPLPPKEAVLISGDQVGPEGLPQGIVLATGSGYTTVLEIASLGQTSPSLKEVTGTGAPATRIGVPGVLENAEAVFNSTGQLQQVTGVIALDAGGSHADFGTDGILAWGRWVGPVNVVGTIVTYDLNQGLHYVIGLPTPVLPTTGTATYALLGATSPTYTDGSTAPGKFDGSLRVDFGALSVDGNFKVAMPDKTYAWTGNATPVGSAFAMSTGTVTGCDVSACSASVSGFFAGPNAERAGVGYRVSDSVAAKDVIGAAAFKKQ